MVLSIIQPYFFPYIGFFQLIHATDQMIVFDTVKYQKRSWMNRNRILHPNKAFNYISMPVRKMPENTPILEIKVVDDDSWKRKILGQISIYSKYAPYYKEVVALLEDCFVSIKTDDYAKLCIFYINKICKYLEIEFHYTFLSKLNLSLPPINAAGDWCLHISNQMEAKTYVNMPKGAPIYDSSLFEHYDIKLLFLQPKLEIYEQFQEKEFISHLSIIDVLMWNSKEKVKQMIEYDYTLLSKEELLDFKGKI
jgi:hypothetical protein